MHIDHPALHVQAALGPLRDEFRIWRYGCGDVAEAGQHGRPGFSAPGIEVGFCVASKAILWLMAQGHFDKHPVGIEVAHTLFMPVRFLSKNRT